MEPPPHSLEKWTLLNDGGGETMEMNLDVLQMNDVRETAARVVEVYIWFP